MEYQFEIEGYTVFAKRRGKDYLGLCPFHGDTKPSLSINPEKGVFHCLGCGRKGRLDVGEKEIEAAYDYRDENGNLLFQVVRYKPKSFSQRRLLNEKWVNNLNNTPRVLYRLPELINSTDPVIIVEGEKSVDLLRKYGLNATCNPGGAGKWQDKYNENLKGRNVIIIPDNDPQGIDHAEAIVKSVQKVPRTVKS